MRRNSTRTPLAVQSLILGLLLVWSFDVSGLEAQGRLQSVDPATGTVRLYANGRDRVVRASDSAQVLDEAGKPLAGGLASPALTNGAPVTVSVNPGDPAHMLIRLQLGSHLPGAATAPAGGKVSVGFKPLTEMTATDRYKGQDGGLYGAGRNDPPPALAEAAKRMTAQIVPLDAEGRPAPDGKIGLVSISMSNATMEYSLFKQLADRDPQKAPSVAVVDCAQGGQAMAEWVDPAARPWTEAKNRLARADVSLKQVQVVWVKLANKGPRGELSEHVDQLKRDTRAVLRNAKARFPNLRVAYLGSRIYAGYAATPLNPEPYAYEGAFAVRGLIQEQSAGDAALAYEGDAAPAPLLLWGPYFWADGTTPRKADGLAWERADLAGDGTHPSESGRRKVADQLLAFFKTDPLASSWFLRK